MSLWKFLFVFFIYYLINSPAANGAGGIFNLENKCKFPVWAGILSGSGQPLLMNGGFQMNPLSSNVQIQAPKGWSGRFWGRTGCKFDPSTGKGQCETGDCGGVLQCAAAGGVPPVSLAEFTLDSPMDFYDVSLVDGYNIPISIFPYGGTGDCNEVKCNFDLNNCPAELKLKDGEGRNTTTGCKSACLAFNKPEYCCSEEFNDPNICKPTDYSKIFKNSCPTSYSFPYDDKTSTFTCKNSSYTITFC